MFIALALIVMGAIGFFVRAGIETTDPPQVTGPVTPGWHDVTGAHANCMNCHADIVPYHDEMFGEGNYDNCLGCHPVE
jgi:hypothetical protein